MTKNKFLTIRFMAEEEREIAAIMGDGPMSKAEAVVDAVSLCRQGRLNGDLLPDLAGAVGSTAEALCRAADETEGALRRVMVRPRLSEGDWSGLVDSLSASASVAREASGHAAGAIAQMAALIRKYDPAVLVRHTRRSGRAGDGRLSIRVDGALHEDLAAFAECLGVSRSEAARFLIRLGSEGMRGNGSRYIVAVEGQIDRLDAAVGSWRDGCGRMREASKTARGVLGIQLAPTGEIGAGLMSAGEELEKAADEAEAALDSERGVTGVLSRLKSLRDSARAAEAPAETA